MDELSEDRSFDYLLACLLSRLMVASYRDSERDDKFRNWVVFVKVNERNRLERILCGTVTTGINATCH